MFDEKELAYEPILGIPLIVRGPGFAPRVEPSALVTNLDLMLTLLDVAGVSPMAGEGRSFRSLLGNPSAEHRSDFLFQYPLYQGVRSDQWKYIKYNNGAEELYDLIADPDELVSRHADPAYAAQKTLMRNRLNQLLGK